MKIEELMTKTPQCCLPDDTLAHAAQLMWDGDYGCLPVCADDGSRRVIGMVTDRDICMAAHFQGRSLRDVRVSEAMPQDGRLEACRPDGALAEVERAMREARVRRLPVVDADGGLVGVISLADLAREAARERTRRRPEISDADVGDVLAAICATRALEPRAATA